MPQAFLHDLIHDILTHALNGFNLQVQLLPFCSLKLVPSFILFLQLLGLTCNILKVAISAYETVELKYSDPLKYMSFIFIS